MKGVSHQTALVICLIIGMSMCAFCYIIKGKGKGKGKEGFAMGEQPMRCPDMLIQKGSRFYLYNSKLAHVPGVNPVEFDSLEDYTEFLEWQKSQNIRCPVLYLQQTYDAQGNRVFKTRPSVSELQGGLPPSGSGSNYVEESLGIQTVDGVGDEQLPPNPTLLVDATHDDLPYNKNSYPAYDESSYYVGTTTPLDAMNTKAQQSGVSANPMDDNWGGSEYTQTLIDRGYYKENEVSIASV
jgi:hypothetical protein